MDQIAANDAPANPPSCFVGSFCAATAIDTITWMNVNTCGRKNVEKRNGGTKSNDFAYRNAKPHVLEGQLALLLVLIQFLVAVQEGGGKKEVS